MKKTPDIKRQIIEQVRSVSQTQKELAGHFGITDRTLANWRAADPEFDAAIRIAEQARETATTETWRNMLQSLQGPALAALKKMVTGYDTKTETKEFKTFRWKDEDGTFHEEEKLVNRSSKKIHVAPSLPAVVFVLSNADPEYFKK